MNTELVDRLVGRIVQETRMARAARHPRARIAHHMLADAYRAMASRLTMADAVDECRVVGVAAGRGVAGNGAPTTGFLADVSG